MTFASLELLSQLLPDAPRQVTSCSLKTLPTPTRPVTYPSIPTNTLDVLTELLERTAPVGGVDRSRLEEDLLSVLYATGVAHEGGVEAEAWHKASGAAPDRKALALGYRRMAEAPDPLDPAICTAERRSSLNRQVHVRWTSRWRKEGRGESGLAPGKWRALLKERGASDGQAAAPVWEGVRGRGRASR